MPDRLPSLIVLAAFWVPPVLAGWAAAGRLQRVAKTERPAKTYAALAAFVVVYAAMWFLYNLGRMPPYIPGATMDPTYASPQAAIALAVFTAVSILPGSAFACAMGMMVRRRMDKRAAESPAAV